MKDVYSHDRMQTNISSLTISFYTSTSCMQVKHLSDSYVNKHGKVCWCHHYSQYFDFFISSFLNQAQVNSLF